MKRTEPSHLQELRSGLWRVYSLLQQTLHWTSVPSLSSFSTTPQSISTASSALNSFSLSTSSSCMLDPSAALFAATRYLCLTGDALRSMTPRRFKSQFAGYLSVLKSLTLNLSLPSLMILPLCSLKSCKNEFYCCPSC